MSIISSTPFSDVTREAIETAYCFLHQKLRVYEHSNMEWQRDDIEYAISSYVDQMPPALYQRLANGKADYLLDHCSFEADMRHAVTLLEQSLGI